MKVRKSPYEVKEDMITEIIEEFDFEKCHKVMLHLDWQWWGRGTPSIQVMKDFVRKNLERAIVGVLDRENHRNSDVPYTVSSGGFTAKAFKNRYGYLDFLKLEFIITDWEVSEPD